MSAQLGQHRDRYIQAYKAGLEDCPPRKCMTTLASFAHAGCISHSNTPDLMQGVAAALVHIAAQDAVKQGDLTLNTASWHKAG